MATPASAKTKEENKASLSKWNRILSTFDNALLAVTSIAVNNLGEGVKEKVEVAIKVLYENVRSVNQQFLEAINDLEAGKPYTPLVDPGEIPEFPQDVTSAKTTATSIWGVLSQVLEMGLSHLPSSSPWVKVLEGLIKDGNETIDTVSKLIDSLTKEKKEEM